MIRGVAKSFPLFREQMLESECYLNVFFIVIDFRFQKEGGLR